MSTNFPLKPKPSSHHPAATFRELLLQHKTTEVAVTCKFDTYNQNKNCCNFGYFCNFCLCSVFFFRLQTTLFFDAIPYHHRSTNLSKIQFSSVNGKSLFFHYRNSTGDRKEPWVKCFGHTHTLASHVFDTKSSGNIFIIENCESHGFFLSLSRPALKRR